jgi:hypothetical protein
MLCSTTESLDAAVRQLGVGIGDDANGCLLHTVVHACAGRCSKNGVDMLQALAEYPCLYTDRHYVQRLQCRHLGKAG